MTVLNYFWGILRGLWNLLVGMSVTIRIVFKPVNTFQYPGGEDAPAGA